MDKSKSKKITNESLSKRFKNSFDLVNYAIHLAENMIHSGRGARVEAETENPAMLILKEIEEGKDLFEPAVQKKVVPNHYEESEIKQELIYEENEMFSVKDSEEE